MAAKRLDLIDVGRLERQHGQQRDAEDDGEIVPGEAVRRHDITRINRKADGGDQREFDGANEAREYDRRIGGAVGFCGD